MVAGLNFYLDSYQTHALHESYDDLADTSISENDNNYMPDYESTLHDQKEKLISYFETYEYIHESWHEFLWIQDFDLEVNSSIDFAYFLPEENFYDSPRFGEYFSIYDGVVPNASNEILIDYSYALNQNLSVGDLITLDYYIDEATDYHFENLTAPISNTLIFEISGIYMPVKHRVSVVNWYYRFFHYMDTQTEEILQSYTGNYFMSKTLVFSYHNFEDSNHMHPVQEMCVNFTDAIWDEFQIQYRSARKIAGLFGVYDRSSLSHRRVLSTSRDIQYKMELIEPKISSSLYVRNYLGNFLENYSEMMSVLRVAFQFMNLPIMGFGVFIGVFSFRISTKERSDEFLLLRSKGIPQRMITRQFLVQAVLLGAVSSTLAILAGRGTFEIYREFLQTILPWEFYTKLPFRISFSSILFVYVVGILMAVVSSIPSIRSINKLESSELLLALGSDELDVAYDETTLFTVNPNQMVKLGDTPFMTPESGQNGQPQPQLQPQSQQQSQNLTDSDRSKKSIFKKSKSRTKSKSRFSSSNMENIPQKKSIFSTRTRDSQSTLYRNKLKGKEKKIRKIGWLLILLSLLPGLYFLLYWIAQIPFIPDSYIRISDQLLQYFEFFIVFAIFSPLVLVIGVSRIFIKENPSRFAKIIKKVAHLFVGQKDYLIALQMIKQKDYRRFINLLAIFTSLFTFANIFFISINAMEIIDYNLRTGADVKYEYSNEVALNLIPDFTPEIINQFENNCTLLADSNGSRVINENAFYIEYEGEYENRVSSREFIINISKYLRIIQEDDKYVPNRAFKSQLETATAFFNPTTSGSDNSTSSLPGIIVTQGYLDYHQKNVGDSITFNYNILTEDFYSSSSITVKIVAALPFFIGLWEFTPRSYYHRSGILFDLAQLSDIPIDFSEDNYYLEFGQLFDLNMSLHNSLKETQLSFVEATSPTLQSSRVRFYYPDITSTESGLVEINVTYLLYQIIYMEFIIIGAILAVGLAIFMLGMLRKNKYLNGLLLSRGMGWRGLNKFMLAQLFIIFVLALTMGIICGIISAFLLMKLVTYVDAGGRQYPLVSHYWDFFTMFGSIIGLAASIYGISFYVESKKNITEYFHKF